MDRALLQGGQKTHIFGHSRAKRLLGEKVEKIAARTIASVLITQVLCGCSIFGPSVLRDERIAYNEAIHDTSAQQLLMNIVRARNFEDPTFSNLAEVDSQPSASGSISGGSANIGALLTLGSLSSTLGGSETSIQKHVSVTGAELIQQISSPITLKNIYRLLTSNAPEIPLIRMSINRLGNSFIAHNRIVELLYLLELFGAITVEARNDNTLTIVLRKTGMLTQTQQAAEDDEIHCFSQGAEVTVNALWDELTILLGHVDKTTIVVRTPEAKIVPDPGKETDLSLAQKQVAAPIVLTRSALGAVRLAEEHDIKFLDPKDAKFIREANDPKVNKFIPAYCRIPDYYMLPDTSQGSPAKDWVDIHRIHSAHDGYTNSIYEARARAIRIVLILVEITKTKPNSAYVSVYRDEQWYSIEKTDEISKKNFALLNTILTIQAAPSSSPTPTTISAGAASK